MRSSSIAIALLLATAVAIAATAGAARPSSARQSVTKITFWHAYAENASAPEMQRLTKIVIPRFEKLHPSIEVEQVPFS